MEKFTTLRGVAAPLPMANVDTDMAPLMGGDDFSYMADVVPACYVFMGNGMTGGLHTTGYDFNDAIIPTGVSYWVALAQAATGA